MEAFPYVIKYTKGNANVVANMQSWMYILILWLNAKLMGFVLITSQYLDVPNFAIIYLACEKRFVNGFDKHEGYLFRFGRLCIPKGSIGELLVREAYDGGIARHFGEIRP